MPESPKSSPLESKVITARVRSHDSIESGVITDLSDDSGLYGNLAFVLSLRVCIHYFDCFCQGLCEGHARVLAARPRPHWSKALTEKARGDAPTVGAAGGARSSSGRRRSRPGRDTRGVSRHTPSRHVPFLLGYVPALCTHRLSLLPIE
jgi:hypothetical protein